MLKNIDRSRIFKKAASVYINKNESNVDEKLFHAALFGMSRCVMKKFEKKIWLATPTMHGEELKYVTEAYETNWMSTVGENINEVERIAAEKAEMKYAVGLSCCTAALHLAVKHAGETLYGKPAISHGALEGKRVFCSDMTFDHVLVRRR